ncbi:hypothetical protein F7D01_02745 [Erythrobacter sp. 3-20A1M]|nr:hypothetical protein F7D01_02745 [Erythrobacter sp. 3-20A1M]
MRRPAATVALAPTALALCACAQQTDLRPLAGHDLPLAPYGAVVKPEPAELLELPPVAAPQRAVELRTRSEEREDDPFDLPPE